MVTLVIDYAGAMDVPNTAMLLKVFWQAGITYINGPTIGRPRERARLEGRLG